MAPPDREPVGGSYDAVAREYLVHFAGELARKPLHRVGLGEQAIDLITSVSPAEDVVAELVRDAEAALRQAGRSIVASQA